MRVLDCAQKVKSAVGGCRGKADVKTHCVRYSLIKRYLRPLLVLIHVGLLAQNKLPKEFPKIRQKM